MATPGAIILDPATKRPYRDPITGRLIRVPPSGDLSCFCNCAPGCNGTVSCVSVTLTALLWQENDDCINGSASVSGTFRLLPRDNNGNPSQFGWSGCFSGPSISCQTPSDTAPCNGGSITSLPQMFIHAACPGIIPGLPSDQWVLLIAIGSPFTDNPNDTIFNCCNQYILAPTGVTAGTTFVLNETGGNPTLTGSVTLNTTCTGTMPSACQDCTAPPSQCAQCITSPPTQACATPPGAVVVDCSHLELCDIGGCAQSVVPGLITCTITPGGTCATTVEYIGFQDDGTGHCIKARVFWDSTAQAWLATITDVRCGGSALMWQGWLSLSTSDGPPAGSYLLDCDSCCGNNCKVCWVTVKIGTSTCANCQDATVTWPATGTIVIANCPTTAWNGTWTLRNCGFPTAGCGYDQIGQPIAAVGGFFLAWGINIGSTGCGMIGTPTDGWKVLSAIPGTNPEVSLTGGDQCNPIGATITLGDGTTITVIA